MIFNAIDHARLATLFNGVRSPTTGAIEPYAGYRPEVREAPNGDTKECPAREGLDHDGAPRAGRVSCRACNSTGRVPNVAPETTRYLHVAEKYHPPEWARVYLARAHWEACKVATALGVPDAYYPRPEDGTLRVLEYQPGGFQPEHTDLNLFTIVCYRSHPEDLEVRPNPNGRTNDAQWARRYEAACMSPGLHIGEIGELVGLGPATPHRVPARPYAQQSIVYFAVPSHAAPLPCECPRVDLHGHRPYRYKADPQPACTGRTVGEWLKERKARSRY